MNEKDYWNDARTLTLINKIKKCPSIWNRASPNYGDKLEKNSCWNEIAAEMEFPVSLVKLKYTQLCQKYYRERHKERKSQSYKNDWTFFPHLDALIGQYLKRRLIKVSSSIGENDIWLDSSAESDVSSAEEVHEGSKLWTDKKLKKFIDMLHKNPILFELNSGSHELIWKAVANKLGCSVNEAKIQKKTLIMTFNTEYKKSLENPNFISNWKYFEDLQFLAYQNPSHPQGANASEQSTVAAATTHNAAVEEIILSESDNENDTVPQVEVDPLLDESWSSNNVIDLIKLVRSHRVLWDEKDANYSNKVKRNEAWTEIAKQKNLSLKSLKYKFNSLITTYYKERKKITKDPSHVICWIYFPYMEFFPLPKQVEMESVIEQAEGETELSTAKRNHHSVIQETVPVSGMDKNTEKPETSNRDEYTIFGEAVANEMRQMSDFKLIQTNFQNKVLKILMEARKKST